jgi:hypothetical protein
MLLMVSLALLYLTESSYGAFRQALQQIQFDIDLTGHSEFPQQQQVRLQWVVTVTMPSVKILAQLELLDWHLRSADGSVHLGFYTSKDIEIELPAGKETAVPLEAVLTGSNVEELQQLRQTVPDEEAVMLLFQGTALVMFELPQGQVRKKIPVRGSFTLNLNAEGE